MAVEGLGTVLVNASGHTLYTFAPDAASKVTCVSTCALVWPPDTLASGVRPVAAGAVKAALLSTKPDPEGGNVVTYAGWPLYTYVADSSAGTAMGQAQVLNGGAWYTITAAGKPVH
jgi:predicted lipoprotein with Yx(FWY)xxD motif